MCLKYCVYEKLCLSLQCNKENIDTMKKFNFDTEKETEKKVLELTRQGITFSVTGRRELIIW